MKIITKQTDYAIRILATMSSNKDSMHTTAQLADKLKIPKPFVRSILQKLNKVNIVSSSKGKGGGFKVKRPADTISVLMLIEVFQGPIILDKCFIRKETCPDIKTCRLKKKLKEMGNYINDEFQTLTLDKLLK